MRISEFVMYRREMSLKIELILTLVFSLAVAACAGSTDPPRNSDYGKDGYVRFPDEQTNLKTLELVQVIFRHGDRTPLRSYPLDPYRDTNEYWPQGLGQLTDMGKAEHYLLGRYFRDRYDGFLSQTYVPHEIFVVSSDTDRTIMSAEANLAGLYQPSVDDNWNPVLPWTPIPIRTIPTVEDKFLRATKSCPKYGRLLTEAMESKPVQEFNDKHRNFIEYVKNHTGINDGDSLEDIVGIEDVLTVEKSHNFLLPSWASQILDKFHRLAAKTFLWHTWTPAMKRLKSGPLLQMLMNNIKVHLADTMSVFDFNNEFKDSSSIDFGSHNSYIVGKAKKLYMYSAHDSTLMRLMDTLGIFDQIMPPYASALIIELHKGHHHQFDRDNLVIKVYYKNETEALPYHLEIPGCGKACPLEKFVQLTKPMIPLNWESECEEIAPTPSIVNMTAGEDTILDRQFNGTNLTLSFLPHWPKKPHRQEPSDNFEKLYVLAEAILVVVSLLVLIVLILFIARNKLSCSILSHTYPYMKSRKNNYGNGYETV